MLWATIPTLVRSKGLHAVWLHAGRVSSSYGPSNLGGTQTPKSIMFFFLGGGAILRHTPNPLWLHICHRKMVKFFTLMTLQIWREAGRLCLELGRRVRWISGGRNFVWTFLCHFINLKETHREKTLEEMLGLTRNGKVFLSTNDFFGGAR